MEGFPFGVLEMLASALPVIAYDAPGPPMMLPSEWLVPRGDWQALSAKAARLLQEGAELVKKRRQAQHASQRFSWQNAAEATQTAYLSRLR